MRLNVEEITPDMAAEMLRATEGTTQRPISPALTSRLVSAIHDGRWQLTHQPIAVTADGVVIDGRHRLTAIWRSGQAVKLLVARDADPATFLAVDTGRSRTPGDMLHIAGYGNTNALAATVRFVMTAKRLAGTTLPWSSTAGQIRSDEVVAFADLNAAEIHNAMAVGSRAAQRIGRYGLRTWLSASVYLIRESTVPADIQNEFFERLSDGEMLAAGSPILSLRRFIVLSFNMHNTKITPVVGMGVTLKAFNVWVSGGTVQVSMFKPGVERFPGVRPWSAVTAETPAESRPLPSSRSTVR